MPDAVQDSILIVEDDLDVAEMLTQYFDSQGYQARAVYWGEDTFEACAKHLPSLVMLDIRLPDIDGFEVARRLRTSRRTREVPIIFLTERRERADRLRGLELQADDYMTKPFDIQELRLRVRNSIERARRMPLNHPVTGLPEGELVHQHLEACLRHDSAQLLVLTLHNLTNFRDLYGFVATDDMLRAISFMINDIVRDLGSPDDFLGQLSLGTFLVVTDTANYAALRDMLVRYANQPLDKYYRSQDLAGELLEGKRLAFSVHEISRDEIRQMDPQGLKNHVGLLAV